MFSLLNLTFFNAIEEKLNNLSPETLKQLIPGSPAPDNAVVLGPMSDDLKALLLWKQSSDIKLNQMTLGLIRAGSTLSDEEITDARYAIAGEWEHNKSATRWFYSALATDFLPNGKAAIVGYNEKFEMYFIPRE